MVYSFYPYKQTVYPKNVTEWGRTEQINLNDFDFNRTDLFDKFKNLNGFPLRMNIFQRYPTAIKVDEFPIAFVDSYLMHDVWRADGYGGVDGFMLANVAKMLNFSAVNIQQIGIDFGYKSTNGSFLGRPLK